MFSRRIFSRVALVVGAIVFSAGLQTHAVFTQPDTAPPLSDVYAPISTSPSAQSKVGGLLLNTGGAVNGLIVQSGNVGIGTVNPKAILDVAGEVGFGNTSSTCNATHEGQQRYNSTSKVMEYCNGTAWTVVGSTSGQAKAWAVFHGGHSSGPSCNPNCTILASYNVTSVIKNSAGNYTVTFTTPMSDANYAVVFGGPGITWGGTYNSSLGVGNDNSYPTTNTASTFKIISTLSSKSSSGNGTDAGPVSFAVFD